MSQDELASHNQQGPGKSIMKWYTEGRCRPILQDYFESLNVGVDQKLHQSYQPGKASKGNEEIIKNKTR